MAKTKDCQTKQKLKVQDKLSNRYWRLNNLYWILDDQSQKVKFKFNAVQYALYTALHWLNVILKSRQHGITTFMCIYFLDACLFNSNTRAGIVAHKLKDAQRIFRDKIKFAYDNLPESIKAERYALKDDAGELLLSNNSSIYVGVSMRSGTLQYLLVSEYGWLCAHAAGKAREIKAGTMETVHEGGMIVIESTAVGMGNDFHKMCKLSQSNDNDKLTRMDYKFHFFPWYIKPENTLAPDGVIISEELNEYFRKIEAVTGDKIDLPHRAWYTKKKEVLGSDIYKEHPSTPDEAFIASLEGAYFGLEMVKAKEQGRIGYYPWENGTKVFTFWDIGSIHTAIWYWQFIQAEVRAIDFYYDNTGQGIAALAKLVLDKPYMYAQHWSGWDLNPDSGPNRKNPVSGELIKDEAKELGIDFHILPKYSFDDRIRAVRDNVLPKAKFNEETCPVGIAALFNYRKSKNQALSTDDRPVYSKDPEHGPECHIADAYGHGALAFVDNIIIDGVRLGKVAPIVAGMALQHSPYDDAHILTRGLPALR